MIDCQDLLALTLAQPIAITRRTASGVLPAAEDDCDRLTCLSIVRASPNEPRTGVDGSNFLD
jgi:hypothetical protein